MTGRLPDSFVSSGTSYSADDDWSLGDEYRNQQDFILKEAYLLPTPAVITTGPDQIKTYTHNSAATALIKEQLLQKRSVALGFFADDSRPWDTGQDGHYINTETWAHYTYDLLRRTMRWPSWGGTTTTAGITSAKAAHGPMSLASSTRRCARPPTAPGS
jgi:hypothetical protein